MIISSIFMIHLENTNQRLRSSTLPADAIVRHSSTHP